MSRHEHRLHTRSQRVLPTTSKLTAAACCPTRDLAVLISAASKTDSATPDAKISLYRTTGAMELIWEWTPAAPASTPAASSKFGFKGKAKAAAGPSVQATAWSPDGDYLAVALSAASMSGQPTQTSANTIVLLSVHTGQPVLPPSSVSTTSGDVSHFSWQSLDLPSDSLLSSHAISVIYELPTLPAIAKNVSIGTGGAGGPPAPTTGIFGAKNAMLQREREKEAGRPLNLQESAPNFPSLLSQPSPERSNPHLPHKAEDTSASVLAVGHSNGEVHMYLGGTVLLGTIRLGEGHRIAKVCALPSTSASARFAVTTSSVADLSMHKFELTIPSSLEMLTRHATLLRYLIQHAFEALQEARALWDESRRIGKAWMARLADLSKSHGIAQPPTTQLLLLLMTGRPTGSLHDFLASKMNEKALNKWEGTTVQALERLRACTFTSIEPAMERAIFLLDEIRAWAEWPEKFELFQLQADELNQAIEIAKQVITLSVHLEPLVLEEEQCLFAFQNWLKFELEKVSQQEGSEIRPTAKFQAIPVAHYIRHCLLESAISPYLDFGLGTAALSANAKLSVAQAWVDDVPAAKKRAVAEDDAESLEDLLRRMKEELKGQMNAMLLEVSRSHDAPLDSSKPPSAPLTSPAPPEAALDASALYEGRPGRTDGSIRKTATVQAKPPNSLPIMLHLLAGKIAGVLDRAVHCVGATAIADSARHLHHLEPTDDSPMLRTRLSRRGQSDTATARIMYTAWISNSQLLVERTDCHTWQTEISGMKLALGSKVTDAVEVVDFDFYDDEEILIAAKIAERSGFALLAVSLEAFTFSATKAQDPPSLIVSRSHQFSLQFPPEALALNGRSGRRVVCVLAGEGRRLEALEADPQIEAAKASEQTMNID